MHLRKALPFTLSNVCSGPKLARAIAHGVLLMLVLTPAAMAQQSGSKPDDEREIVHQLLLRIAELEKRVKELETKQAPPAPPTNVLAESAHKMPEQEHNMGVPEGGPNLRIRGFGDVRFRATDARGDTNSFSLGQLDLFVTSRLSDTFSFLSEIVFEADPTNAFGIDVERLLLQYSPNDYFNFGVGRYHTAIGYYSTAYHHGTWFQTTTGRPFIFRFEDQGGILPIHSVGITANGRVPSGGLGLHYVAELGNGRASRSPLSEAVQNVVDENNHKAFNLGLYARPDEVPGLQAGFSVYRDLLTPAGAPKIGQTILAAHVVYVKPSFEWLNEALMIRHAPLGASRIFHTPAFYTQISRRFGLVRPYFRYEYVNAPANEPVFSDITRRNGPSLGLRFDVSEFSAFKVQYDRTARRGQPVINGLELQFAFTF